MQLHPLSIQKKNLLNWAGFVYVYCDDISHKLKTILIHAMTQLIKKIIILIETLSLVKLCIYKLIVSVSVSNVYCKKVWKLFYCLRNRRIFYSILKYAKYTIKLIQPWNRVIMNKLQYFIDFFYINVRKRAGVSLSWLNFCCGDILFHHTDVSIILFEWSNSVSVSPTYMKNCT